MVFFWISHSVTDQILNHRSVHWNVPLVLFLVALHSQQDLSAPFWTFGTDGSPSDAKRQNPFDERDSFHHLPKRPQGSSGMRQIVTHALISYNIMSSLSRLQQSESDSGKRFFVFFKQQTGKLTLVIDFCEAVKQLEVEQRWRHLLLSLSSGEVLQQVKIWGFITCTRLAEPAGSLVRCWIFVALFKGTGTVRV